MNSYLVTPLQGLHDWYLWRDTRLFPIKSSCDSHVTVIWNFYSKVTLCRVPRDNKMKLFGDFHKGTQRWIHSIVSSPMSYHVTSLIFESISHEIQTSSEKPHGASSLRNSDKGFSVLPPNNHYFRVIIRRMNDTTFCFNIVTATIVTICDGKGISHRQ